jgi:hypothetical protein
MYRVSPPVIGIPDKYNILPRETFNSSLYLEIYLEVVGGNPQKAPFHLLPQLKRENQSAWTSQDERSREMVIVFH